MAIKGQILTNPDTGDIYEFLETAKDTNGEYIKVKMTLNTKGELVPNHFHVLQDESFEILSGNMTVWLDNKLQTVASGNSIFLPKNVAHNHYNAHDEALVYIHKVSPALDFEFLLENLIGLTADGKMKNGKAGLVQELVTLKYLDSKSYLADIPVAVQNVLMNLVAPIAKLLGYRAIYKKYSGFEK